MRMPVSRALSNFKGLLIILPALIPLLPIHLSSGILVAWAILSFFYFLAFPEQRIQFPKLILLPLAIFALFIISWPFSIDHANQASYVERNLAWLIIPLAYWMLGVTHLKQWLNILRWFTIAFTLDIVYAHASTYLQIQNFSKLTPESLTFNYRTLFENICGLHPAYVTLFSGLCVVYCISFLVSENQLTAIKKVLILFVALFHLASTIILASRMALIATIASLLFLIITNRKFLKEGLMVIASFVIVGVFFIVSTPFFSSRIHEVSNEALVLPATQTNNTLSIRTGIYTCALSLLKSNWLLGLTPGDLQINLNNCYGNIGADNLKKEEYNTHNEYLNKWLCFGIIGFASFIALLLIPFIISYKQNNSLFICFIILMSISLFSENMFSRQYGLFFFLIIYSPLLIILNNKQIKQARTNN